MYLMANHIIGILEVTARILLARRGQCGGYARFG
jgi:hypothetical protein